MLRPTCCSFSPCCAAWGDGVFVFVVFSLCAISIDRYLAISRPIMYKGVRSKRLAVYICLGMWLLSFLITCPPLFGW